MLSWHMIDNVRTSSRNRSKGLSCLKISYQDEGEKGPDLACITFTSYRKSHYYRYSVRKMKTEINDWSGILSCLSSCTISNMDVYSITQFIVLSKQSYEALSWQSCCNSVYSTSYLTESCVFWRLFTNEDTLWCLS